MSRMEDDKETRVIDSRASERARLRRISVLDSRRCSLGGAGSLGGFSRPRQSPKQAVAAVIEMFGRAFDQAIGR